MEYFEAAGWRTFRTSVVAVGYEYIQSCGGEDMIALGKNERLAEETQPHLTSSRPGLLRRIWWASGWRTIGAAARAITKWRPTAIGGSLADWRYGTLVPGELQGEVWLLHLMVRDQEVSGRRY